VKPERNPISCIATVGFWCLFAAVTILLIYTLVMNHSRAGGHAEYSLYLPVVAGSLPIVTILPADILAGGCWSVERCAYLIAADRFAEVAGAGAVVVDDMAFRLVGEHTFACNKDFEDHLWTADGAGLWMIGNRPDRYIQFR
jgi:hypothetical protein